MNTVETILARRSVRKYADEKVDREIIEEILKCGMSGPTAVNARPWSFIVVDDREELGKWADAAGRAGDIIRSSAFSTLIIGDLERAFKRAPEYWIIDGAISGQNMILAARDNGIGSVWLGVWPQQDKIEAHKAYFHLPEDKIPHSVIAFGYPAEDDSDKPHMDYEKSRVHFNKW